MKGLGIIKKASTLVTSAGVGTIVSYGVKFVTPIATLNPVMKVCVYAGSFVLSSMIADKSSQYVEEQIDDISESVKNFLDGINENEEEEITENNESHNDFQLFKEKILKECVNAHTNINEDDENGES